VVEWITVEGEVVLDAPALLMASRTSAASHRRSIAHPTTLRE